MVCGSRFNASARATAVQPWASNSTAYQRSRSRDVGARIIRRCTSWASISHCSRDRSISLTLITNPFNSWDQLASYFTNLTYLSAHFTLALV